LHEYQAAQLLADYQVPILLGKPAFTAEEAIQAAQEIEAGQGEAKGLVIKAQIHAGGRGRGTFRESGLEGGVHLVDDASRIVELAPQMIGNTLVTKQSGAAGKPCNALYVVEQVAMARELYVAIMLDRSRAAPILICSSIGGMGIEEIDKEYIKTFEIDPSVGITEDIVQQAVDAFDVPAENQESCAQAVRGLYNCFAENEATLVEVNPYALLEDGRLLVCDTKVNIDDSSEFRHKELFALDDLTQKDPSEVEAESWELNYVKLDGHVGCLVNGAGLAMATMDYIKFNGGDPANFLDVGGTSTVERVFEAVRIINEDEKVDSILVNIFGGIVRCDIIVDGVIKAMRELSIDKPVVLRIKGTNADIAQETVANAGLPIYWENTVQDAVQKVVALTA